MWFNTRTTVFFSIPKTIVAVKLTAYGYQDSEASQTF